MKSIEEQINIIKTLIGDNNKIQVKEDGFLSRGFIINDGRLVFKFSRNTTVKYDIEIEILNYINSLSLSVNLQKVAFIDPDNEYLGIYGVLGKSLEEINLTKNEEKVIGSQLGVFLNELHSIKTKKGIICGLKEEISAWQMRIKKIGEFISSNFTKLEQEKINILMFKYVPEKLYQLGENLVFSHGDLGDGNIFVDTNMNVGVIDFNESGFFEEAADFMDVSSDILCEAMLKSYNANEILVEKVKLRRSIRPLIVLKSYVERNDKYSVVKLVNKIKQNIKEYDFW